MTIAPTVQTYLEVNHIPYMVLSHGHTGSSKETARKAHVPAERLAKAVVLADEQGYLMAVLPSNRRVDVQALSRQLGRQLAVVPEYRMGSLFKDCDFGAIPPLGFAYGIPTVFDHCLVGQPEVYFEAGDHEEVVCISGERFRRVLRKGEQMELCE